MGSPVSPRSVCIEAARNILSLVKAYQDLYTLRRTPSLTPYLILTAGVMAMMEPLWKEARGGSPKADTIFYRSIEYLNELASSHGFARNAKFICEFFRQAWNVGTERDMDYDDREELNNIKNNHEFGLDWPHARTFFQPDTKLKRLRRGVSSSVARRSHSSTTKAGRSRPYVDVQRSFEQYLHSVLSVWLRGEDENDRFREEINSVIQQKVDKLTAPYALTTNHRGMLQGRIMRMG